MKKNTKASFIVSLICAILMLSLMIPTGAINALADNNAKNGVDSTEVNNSEVNGNNNGVVDENKASDTTVNNGEKSSEATVVDGNTNPVDMTVQACILESNNEVTVNGVTVPVEIVPPGAGCLRNDNPEEDYTTFIEYEYYEDTINVTANSSSSFYDGDYYEHILSAQSYTGYKFKSMKIGEQEVVEDGNYELSANTKITVNFEEDTAKHKFTIDASGGFYRSTEKPTGWDIIQSGDKQYASKEFPEGTSYDKILGEWKNSENNYFNNFYKEGYCVNEDDPLGQDFNPEDTLSENVTFSLNWTTAITVTMDPSGGTVTNKPSDWTYDDDSKTYTKSFSQGTYEAQAAFDWRNATFTRKGYKYNGLDYKYLTPMEENTTLTAQWGPIPTYSVTFTTGDDSEYLDMFVDGETQSKESEVINNIPEGTLWNMEYTDASKTCTITLGDAASSDSHSVELKAKDAYKDVLYPKFTLDGSEATSGTITKTTKFLGEKTWYENTTINFDFAAGSEDKGKIWDYSELHDASFSYVLPKGIKISYYAYQEDNIGIILGDSETGEEELQLMLIPDEDAGVNSSYFTLNGNRIEKASSGKISDGDTFDANFYKEPVVEGYVTDSSSKESIEWANLKLIDASGNTLCETQSSNNSSGYYYMHAPAGSGYKVICTYYDEYYSYTSDSFDLDSTDKTLNIPLDYASPDSTITCSGYINTYVNGKIVPVENAAFIYSCLDTNFVTTGYTDENGYFSVVIPKDQPGIFTVFTQGRMSEFTKYLEGHSGDFSFDDAIMVYTVDQSVSATLSVDPDSEGYGLIERDYGMPTQGTTFTDVFDVATIGEGEYKYPTCEQDASGVVTITSIYGDQYKYTPLRYGGCFFDSWSGLSDGSIKQTFTAIVKFDNTRDYSLSVESSVDNFDNYVVAYKNSEGEDIKNIITTPLYSPTQKLYDDTVLTRGDNNTIILSYWDEGEIEGGTYSESLEITTNSVSGYIVDTISVDGKALEVFDTVKIHKDTNVAITFTEGSIVEGSVYDSETGETISAADIKMIDNNGNTVGTAVSGDNGEYSIQIPSSKIVGSDTFVVICKDFEGEYFDFTSDEFSLESGSITLNIPMKYANPEETVLFEGIVIAPDYEQSYFVSNAGVKFSCLDSNFMTTTYTDNEGKFSARIPKNQSGTYSVDTQARFSPHMFIFDSATQSPSGIVIPVYQENTIYLNVTFKTDDATSEFGIIEQEVSGVKELNNSFKLELPYSTNGAYPTYTVNDDDSITVTSIYFEEYTFSPKRYGGCSFVSWDKELPASGDIKQDFTISAIFNGDADFDLTLNCTSNGFEYYDWCYEENDGYHVDYTIYENPFSLSEYLYNGTQIVRNEDNTLSFLYSDAGEVVGEEYSEQLVVGLGIAEGYDLDSILINGETIDKSESCFITSDTDIDFTLKAIDNPTPVTPSDDASYVSGTSNSASTSDYMVYAIIALFILASCSISGLFVRSRKNQ